MKVINKIAVIFSKILEIGHWVCAVAMLVLFVCSFKVINPDNTLNITAVAIFAAGAALILGLMAMVFRNICLILKIAHNSTPFHKDIVRMLRDIGIFLFASTVISMIAVAVASAVLGSGAVESSGGLESLTFSILILCLSNYFERGTKLEEEIDGLV